VVMLLTYLRHTIGKANALRLESHQQVAHATLQLSIYFNARFPPAIHLLKRTFPTTLQQFRRAFLTTFQLFRQAFAADFGIAPEPSFLTLPHSSFYSVLAQPFCLRFTVSSNQKRTCTYAPPTRRERALTQLARRPAKCLR
jgi:hypothetical protein